ncbi:MAG TPA: tetratricopeptide repeat protein [Kofleriaceae bacterium]|jgi:tetratricopeptide (TPR) repeat protein
MADQQQFQEAAAAVKHSPHAVSAWERVEQLAAELDKPDDVVALYNEVLAGEVEPQTAEMIGERASAFCDEWFGDDPSILERILVRVVKLAPASDSALQRLSVIYTVHERWADALALYDRAIEATKDKSRRVRLLREAAQLAKDVANQPDKAIGYYQRLLPLTPEDALVSQNLERLLERHERWADLIQLWESRIEGQSKRDRERSRARIATVWLDNLRDPARALAAAKPLLAEADDDRESTALLERIIESAAATKPTRDAALDLLRSHHDAAQRPREVVRVIEKVIALDPTSSGPLREEAGSRLAELDDLPAAMDHYAALLAMAPDSTATEEKLRKLAERGGHHDRYAEGVATAARTGTNGSRVNGTRQVALLSEAARTRLERLRDTEGAIGLLVEASGVDGAHDTAQLGVARKLAGLYAETNRPRERLGALERQAHLEGNAPARSALLAEAAKLAESLGDTERALALWERRIDSDPSDLSGLDARISILQAQERWDDLVAALESRAQKVTAPNQQRADLVRIALVHHQQRRDLPAAIDAWQRVVAANADDEEGVSALADLLADTQRWREMADLLEQSSGRGTHRTVARLVRLGDALRAHLGEPKRAGLAYRNAIAIEPGSRDARSGLTALLDGAETRAHAADALAQAFRTNGDLAGVLDLLPARLAEAHDDRTRLALLREAAQLRVEHTHDQPGALADLANAFPLAPRDQLIEHQLHSLAQATGDWHTAARAYEAAIHALDEAKETREAARLRLAYGDLLVDHLADPARAADAYAQVAAVEPGNRRAVHAVAHHGGQLGRWDDAATIVTRYMGTREAFDEELLSILESAAQHAGGSDAFASALHRALDEHKLPATVHALAQQRASRIHKEHRGDRASAIAALRRALELGGERIPWLADLVALEREQAGGQPTVSLLDALRRLADADARDLDSLVGAADVAAKLGDREQALSILSAVLGRATAAWRGTASIRSARSVDAVAKWAIDALVDLYRTGGRARAAVDTLVEAARLPFDQNTRREMRLRAAQIATVELGDNAAAIDMYRSVLAQTPNDLDVIERLAHLLGLEDRVPELLTLRQIQLGLESDPEKKLLLRLELARLVGIVEERGGRLDALKANLEERPGHEASIDAVSELLHGKGAHRQLADLLEGQAQRLEGASDLPRAAKLWARYANVVETSTKEVERAIAGHRKVVAIAPTSDSLRALARLNLERSQPGQAVPWLESLLGTVPSGERLLVVAQLAKAHLSASQPDRAIAAIEINLDEREPGPAEAAVALELRTLLAELYRKGELWEPLARHLTRSLPLLKDEKLARDFAREASSIYLTKLGSPAKAIPALETALALDPTDKDLRTALATGQRVAGKLPEARAALTELINDFGRRRSPERAALHVELARVSLAEGKPDEAMAEMESASKMDVSNAGIQKELAEMARASGQLDKAERTYRALLLVVRRTPPGDDEAAVGASEVLFELHHLAAQRGEKDQAKELLESAMEAAIQSDAEVRRLRRSLIAHGEGELLLKVLEKRLGTNPEAHSQARLLADMAEALDTQLNRGPEALEALIRAINVMPSRTELHERARELAKRTGQTKRFVEAVEAVIDRLRRKDDPPLIANLLMRAGEALEQDANDLRAAASLYRRVEILGERLAEAFYAQARVAAALGDTAEQARTLDKMFELAGTDAEPTPAQVDALYRLAEIFLASETRKKQGFDLLERAFAAEPRWSQAGRLLKMAAAADASDERVMAMYERVARNGGDGEQLLDFLERRASLPSATPSQIREAVDLAVEQGQEQRAEALLVRAVAAARDTADGLGSAPWAVLALAERRLAAGDLTAARDLTYEIAPIAEQDHVDALAMRIATRALAHRKVDLAADVYEFLRERNPADRAVWQPLLAIYRELGDSDRLGSVISSTLPNLVTAGERNALRLEHARFLVDNLKRHHDALDVLRDALADDADNLEAAELYESTLRHLGDDEGIAEFLWSRFEDAQRRGHRDSTVDVALRLGDLLEKTGSTDAIRVYRAALNVAPDDREILRRVVAQLGEHDSPREGAVLMERLLAVETPDAAPALAGQLATMWEAAGDVRGVQRTLELAHRSAPDDTGIHDRLEQWYRDREQWAELAELMTRDSERAGDDRAVERLREAASVYSGFLGQPLKAAEVLRKARLRAPHVAALVTDHAAALAAAGELDAAQRAIGEALATVHGEGRTSLLLLRANFRQQLGDDASAVADLTEAYDLDKERVTESLVHGLEKLRLRAERDGDLPTERTATLRLAQLLTQHGELERGRAFLVGWIERDPRDAEPLYMLCDLDESIGHWDGVAAAATRLAYVTDGDAQVQAALRTASSAQQAGRPGEAVPVLELVHNAQPAVEVLRDKLRELYDAAGEYRLLAGVLVADAEHGTDPAQRYANYKRAAELYLYHLEDSASAQHPASKALELQPEDHAALMLNVDVLIQSGALEDAGRTLEAAISAQKKRTPELAVLQQRMGKVSAALGDKDGHLNWLKKAFDVDRKNAEVAAELAQLATEMGDYELALKPLRAITLMDNPAPVTRPMALLWEAKIEHARGNRAKAELWAKKALREDPAFADAQQFLDELGGA